MKTFNDKKYEVGRNSELYTSIFYSKLQTGVITDSLCTGRLCLRSKVLHSGHRGRAVKSAVLITRSFHRCVWCGFEPRTGQM